VKHNRPIAHGLRVAVWILLAWIFVIGVASFFTETEAASNSQGQELGQMNEPPGLRSDRFVREYLTRQPSRSEERAQHLATYTASGLDMSLNDGAGTTNQQVQATWVHSVKSVSPTRWLVTVVTLVTDPTEIPPRPTYLAVPVGQTPEGGWVVYDYPTLVPHGQPSLPAFADVALGLPAVPESIVMLQPISEHAVGACERGSALSGGSL